MVTIEFLPKKDLKPGWKGTYLEAMLHRKHVAFNGIEYYRFIKIRQGEIKTLHKYYQNTILYFLREQCHQLPRTDHRMKENKHN